MACVDLYATLGQNKCTNYYVSVSNYISQWDGMVPKILQLSASLVVADWETRDS